jgi:hypothetical protein
MELATLVWVSMDYESVESIRHNVAQEIGFEVSDEEVGETLLALFSKGLVQAYRYDQEVNQYVPQQPFGESAITELWWLATDSGLGTAQQ